MSRVVVISFSSLLLVGLVAAVTFGLVTNWGKGGDSQKLASSAKAVQSICQPTDYKEACFKSLSNVKSDDPKELVRAAFESAKAEISEVAQNSSVLKELQKDPKTAQSVEDCKELFQDAIDDLQRSFEEIGQFEWDKVNVVLDNLKTWLSATITYQETCLDGFENTTGDASEKMRKVLQTASQMSSNGLAIVTDMASLLGNLDMSGFNKRRLLSTNLDNKVMGHSHNHEVLRYWFEKKNRKLLGSSVDDENTPLEDYEGDKRRRKLLSSVDAVIAHDGDVMPVWLDAKRRKLLEATNLTEDLKAKANVTVAKDGSGKYKTIEEALNEIPKNGNDTFIVYIKEGVYNEYLVLYKWMTHVVFVGDGPTKTRITNNKNFVDGVKTFKTATLSVLGDFFMAKDIGVENSAGAIKHQAVAIRIQSDLSIFFNCHFDGYQDTLYAHTYRQYYRDCRVTGTIDFVFGDAASFFQNCTFVVRKPLDNQNCIVTAQGRMERHQPTGIIIHKSRFEADADYFPLRQKNKAYLGRPWKEYSKTVIMESHFDDLIQPDGWLPWEGNFGLETCYYGEYNNVGPGSALTNRVKWGGIKTISYARAEKFMPPLFYESDEWIKASGVPYDPILSAPAPGSATFLDGDVDLNAPAGAPGASSLGSSSSSGSSLSSSSSSYSHGGSATTGIYSSQGSSSSGASSSSGSTGGEGAKIVNSGSTSRSSNTGSSSAASGVPGEQSGSGSGSSSRSSNSGSSSSVTGEQSGLGSGSRSDSSKSSEQLGLGSGSSSTMSSDQVGSSTSTSSAPLGSSSEQASAPAATPESSTTAPAPTDSISEATLEITSSTVNPPTKSQTSKTQKNKGSPDASPNTSPSSITKAVSKKSTGPVTVRELERMLMENEEMDEVNDDMSGNLPDGDEPSPAKVQPPSPASLPTIATSPSQTFEVTSGPSLAPSTGSSPSPSPSEELADWLPPGGAPGPAPDTEPADKAPLAPPPKGTGSKSKYELHVALSGLVMWVALAM